MKYPNIREEELNKMNNTSKDEIYTKSIGNLREKLKKLAEKIEPKVYEYGFDNMYDEVLIFHFFVTPFSFVPLPIKF